MSRCQELTRNSWGLPSPGPCGLLPVLSSLHDLQSVKPGLHQARWLHPSRWLLLLPPSLGNLQGRVRARTLNLPLRPNRPV